VWLMVRVIKAGPHDGVDIDLPGLEPSVATEVAA
jgi:hypothetical protein